LDTWNSKNHKKGPSRIWIRKQDKLNVEEFSLAQQAQRIISDWYVENGCSKHMIGDKNRFISLKKERYGSILFGNDNSAKIIGKGTIKLGSKDVKAKNVLLVENMKNNLLSVSKMFYQGYRLIFDS
jgi:hypothetical protein